MRLTLICQERGFRVSTAVLDHGTPCLAFAIEETAHVNVWKKKLSELGLPVGPWLHDLKRAAIEDKPNDHTIRIPSREERQRMPGQTKTKIAPTESGRACAKEGM